MTLIARNVDNLCVLGCVRGAYVRVYVSSMCLGFIPTDHDHFAPYEPCNIY